MSDELRSWVVGRVKAIIDAGLAGQLKKVWPADVPTLKASDAHTPEQLGLIAEACSNIEGVARMPLPEPDPRQLPAEGPAPDPATLAELKETLKALPAERKVWLGTLSKNCKDAGHPIGLTMMPTERRVEIVRALVALSKFPDHLAVDLIATVTEAPDSADVGVVVGTLTTAQARLIGRLAAMTERIEHNPPQEEQAA